MSSANQCPAGHPMSARPPAGGFSCDECNCVAAPGESSLTCGACDFDRCIGCACIKADIKCPTCDRNVLGRTVTTHASYRCDECEASIPIEASTASCRACDYDMCHDCTFTKILTGEAGGGGRGRAAADLTTFPGMWAEVNSLESKRLPKSVLALVKDVIIPAARAADDHAQLLKATIYLAKGTIETEDVGMDAGMRVLESELRNPTFVTAPSEVAFLHSMMGELYSRYLDLVRHTIRERTDPGEAAPLDDDIKVWAPAQIERTAFAHYAKSVADPAGLAAEKTSDYDAVLTTPFDAASLGGRMRPTLLDFIGHRALKYFSNENSFLTEPSNRFVLRDKKAFDDAKAFGAMSFVSSDPTSRRYRALLTYQSMLRVKVAALEAAGGAANSDALFSLVSLDLLRIAFVKNSLKGLTASEIRTLHGNALRSLLERSRTSPAAAAAVLVALGDHHRTVPLPRPAAPADGAAPEEEDGSEGRFDLPTALAFYKEAEALCAANAGTNPVAEAAATRNIEQITSTSLNIVAEAVVAPGAASLLSTTSKNIDKVTYRIVALTRNERAEYDEIRGNDVRRTFILAKERSASAPADVTIDLKRPTDDCFERSVELVLPPIAAVGHYAVVAWEGADPASSAHISVAPVLVSAIAVMKVSVADKMERHVTVHRTTGAPLAGVRASVRKTEWNGSKRSTTEVGTATSDVNGFIDFPEALPRGANFNVAYSIGDDLLDMHDGISRHHRYGGDQHTRTSTYFFLDRNMYRPGQTIYFKGLVVESTDGGHTDDAPPPPPPRVCKGRTVQVVLRDSNYQERATVSVTTNDYGSFEATFAAPLTGLTGRMSLETDGGSAHFRVEEYKRPRFEVSMKAPSQAVRVGGEAKVEGTATGFSGIPLGGASIKYRVRRVARAPWFWGFWGRAPRWGGKSAEVLSGEAVADEKGKFTIAFTAVPDADLPAEDRPEFDFEVTADVTDVNGETQSGQATTKVGYVALAVDVPLQETMPLSALKSLPVRLTDLNGNAISASASIALEPLVTPYPIGCPFVSRLWGVPHRIAMDKASFKKALPQFAYTDESSADRWAKEGPRYERAVVSGGTDEVITTDLHQSQLRPNAHYRVSVSATDAFGTPVTVSRTVQVFDDTNDVSVSIASAQSPSLYFGTSEGGAESSPSYRVGDVAVVRYGKRLRFDGLPQPVLVGLSTLSQAATPEWDLTDARGAAEALVQQRAVAVQEADRGYLTAACSYVAYGRVFVASASASVPWVEKTLAFEYLSFRSKLEPGAQEEWRIKVKSADPQADASAAIAAEVVASLYDASLDKLKGNSAHSFANGPQSLFRMASPTLYFNSGSGFHSSHGNDVGDGSNRGGRGRYGYNEGTGFPSLSWFGLPFRSEREDHMVYACRGMPMAMCGAAPMMMMARNAAPAPMMAMMDERGGGGPVRMKRMAKKGGGAEVQGAALMADAAPMRECADACEGGADNDAAGDEAAAAPAVRTNLKETVFFMPTLRTDADGTVVLRFTMGEALTRWRLLAFAHTPDLKCGTHSDASIVTQKELMVTPNPPRFLREGDTLRFAAKVTNMGDAAQNGTASLEVLDGITGAPLNELYGLTPAAASVAFSSGANGQSAAVSWPLKVPYGGPGAVTWRIVARAGRIGDGEEAALPVVTNRMLVTETLPMSVRGGQSKTFSLKSLAALATAPSATLGHEAYTVEFTSNPAWYAVQALPYMMEFPHECSEQLFTRYYANALATHVTQRQPQIQRVFEAWKLLGSDALKSNLARNEELKGALLEETPWVLEAQSEEQQRQQIALLFDLNRMATEQSAAVEKLKSRQSGDGGFAWFPGGRGSLFITQHIAMGLAHLTHLGAGGGGDGGEIHSKAQAFCHRELLEHHDRLLASVKLGHAKLSDQHVGHSQLLYLYTESFAALHPSLLNATARSSRPEVAEYYIEQAATYWTGFNLYGQALIALIHHRRATAPGTDASVAAASAAVAQAIVASLKERSLHSEEMGSYWRYDSGFAYYEAPIETHSLMIEVFREVALDAAFVDELRLWLLKNKQTKHWKTTKQTSEAVYALLLGGESWLDSNQLVSVTVGGAPLPTVNAEPGTGYVKHRYTKQEVTPAMATVAVANPNPSVAWGAAYWQYFEDLDKIKWFAETPLKIKKEVFGVSVTERGETLRPLAEGAGLAVGDKVRIRVEVRVDREMSYVHLKGMRASGLEPTNVLSQYKYQEGVGYYESTKDLATHFFMDHLPKGTFVFEYTLVASQRGEFSNGVTTMQCMYAPEFTSHSQGIRITIN